MLNKQLFPLLLIAVCLSSCLTVRQIERNCDKFYAICVTDETETTEIRDTVWIEKRDTVIEYKVEKETVTDTVFLAQDGGFIYSDTSMLFTGLARSEAFIYRNKLYHFLESGDTILNIRLNNAITERNRLREELSTKVQTVTVKEDTPFGKFAKRWFIGTIIVIVLGILGYILKLKLKF